MPKKILTPELLATEIKNFSSGLGKNLRVVFDTLCFNLKEDFLKLLNHKTDHHLTIEKNLPNYRTRFKARRLDIERILFEGANPHAEPILPQDAPEAEEAGREEAEKEAEQREIIDEGGQNEEERREEHLELPDGSILIEGANADLILPQEAPEAEEGEEEQARSSEDDSIQEMANALSESLMLRSTRCSTSGER